LETGFVTELVDLETVAFSESLPYSATPSIHIERLQKRQQSGEVP
jgi:hypothetical protein